LSGQFARMRPCSPLSSTPRMIRARPFTSITDSDLSQADRQAYFCRSRLL
jgi:hypothetical protein